MIKSIIEGCKVIFDTTIKLFSNDPFEYLWRQLGMENNDRHIPILKGCNKGQGYITYVFTIPIGLSIDDFYKNKAAIAQRFHHNSNEIDIELVNGMALITIKEGKIDSYRYEDYRFEDELDIPLGIDLNGNIVKWSYANLPSLLLAGSSGSGKSVTLGVVVSYIVQHIPKAELYLVDTKYVDLFLYKDAKQTKCYLEGKEGVEDLLTELIEIMNERYKTIKNAGYRDVSSYNKNCKDKINPIFVVIEEIGSFNSDRKSDKLFYELLTELMQKCRGSLIEVILTSQTPYVSCLPNTIKNNIGTIIGLRTTSRKVSESICGDGTQLTSLRGRGHAKIFNDSGMKEFQVFNINDDTIRCIVKEGNHGK